jgi:LruC domain-containing protein
MKIDRFLIAAAIAALALTSCLQSTPVTPTPTPDPVQDKGFTFDNTQKVKVEISAHVRGQAIAGAPIKLFQGFNADGTVNQDAQIFEGITEANGAFSTTVTVPSDQTSLGVRLDYIGVISEPIKLNIVNGAARLNYDDENLTFLDVVKPSSLHSTNLRATAINYTYQYLGGFGAWNNDGVPNNLIADSSKVTFDMLKTINATIPEYSGLPNDPTRSQYIARDSSTNLVLKKPSEVWLTFVHEGAGYKNAVGYYLYNASDPPRSVNDIKDRMIFAYPNASYAGSGGGLRSGNRVKLRYQDPISKQFSDTFPAGTGVGWFLMANGWRDKTTGVLERPYEQTVFSDPVLNYQTYKAEKITVAQSAQTVLLKDDGHQTLLLGFEDILRHHGGDQDFNDAVLLIEAADFTAIQTENIIARDPENPEITRVVSMKPVQDPNDQDSDSDGVSNPFDAYPNDPGKAFNSIYPSKGDYGTLIFEDLWPKLGDYDFNDMVIDYNVTHVANAKNQLVQIQAEYVLRALGGGFHNGFAFSTNLTPNQVSSVSYTWEKEGIVQPGNPPRHFSAQRLTNGLEPNQARAVVPVFDDGYEILPPSLTSRPYYSNVVPTEPYKIPGKVKVTIDLTQPLALTAPGTAPYNPFLIANGVNWGRNVEVHLPNQAPTALADKNLLKTDQDTSDAKTGRYYIDTNGRPWAINLPTQFTHVKEQLDAPGGSVSLGIDIRNVYLKFDDWINSLGSSSKDWYRDLPAYRESNKLYIVQ